MNKLLILLIAVLILNNCSFNENSRIWSDKENKSENQGNTKKIFSDDKKLVNEFNQELKLDLKNITVKKKNYS